MKINVTVGGRTYTATLEDNAAAQALVDRLPLAVSMKELNGNEKYADLAKPLPAAEQSVGRISADALSLYAPRARGESRKSQGCGGRGIGAH